MPCTTFLLGAVLLIVSGTSCDPVTGSGAGTPPNPSQYLKVDVATRSATLILIAGYPATDFQFNYDGYGNGTLVLQIPVGWHVTVQCLNRSTVPNSCAVVDGAAALEPLQPGWSTPDPRQGLAPGQSASFDFAPAAVGTYRIASLVRGSEASGMWLELRVVAAGEPSISASR